MTDLHRVTLCGLAASLSLGVVAGCNTTVECSSGELRYAGRPPRELFSYDRSCREDCFAMPQKACKESCNDVNVAAPSGMLIDDRQLVLADVDSLGESRALLYSFTFIDEADGDAPPAWGFLAAGPRTYLSDQLDGTARFVMETMVVDYTIDANGLIVPTGMPSEAQRATPGRLEVRAATADSIAGRFFLGWERNTGQAQGEVLGCFDLSVGAPVDLGGLGYRLLGP